MLLPGKAPKPRTQRGGSHTSCPSSPHTPAFLHWYALNLSVAAIEVDTKKKGACPCTKQEAHTVLNAEDKELGGRGCVHLLGRKTMWSSSCALTGEEDGVIHLMCIYCSGLHSKESDWQFHERFWFNCLFIETLKGGWWGILKGCINLP